MSEPNDLAELHATLVADLADATLGMHPECGAIQDGEPFGKAVHLHDAGEHIDALLDNPHILNALWRLSMMSQLGMVPPRAGKE